MTSNRTMYDFISGIQEIGVGTNNATAALDDFRDMFHMDTVIYDDTSKATLLARLTGGQSYDRRGILAVNMAGGGGLKIIQPIDRTAQSPAQPPRFGDIGIYAPKIKCTDISDRHKILRESGVWVSDLQESATGKLHFWMRDSAGNYYDIRYGLHWFEKPNAGMMGGVCGAVIGVKDMDRAIDLYKNVLGFSEVFWDDIKTYSDNPDGLEVRCRRVVLYKEFKGKGGLSKLMGASEIELVQVLDREPATIFAGRMWGDCGFTHICFETTDMDATKDLALRHGFQFTIDSRHSYKVGGASGRFAFLETADGTLIKIVETHQVPVLKRTGLHINLRDRKTNKPLPDWLIRLLALNKKR